MKREEELTAAIDRVKKALEREPVAGEYLHNDWRGWRKKLFAPAIDALAAVLLSTPKPKATEGGAPGREDILDLYRMAAHVDVTMEGAHFLGVNRSAFKRVWEADRAALTAKQTDGRGGGMKIAITLNQLEICQIIADHVARQRGIQTKMDISLNTETKRDFMDRELGKEIFAVATFEEPPPIKAEGESR